MILLFLNLHLTPNLYKPQYHSKKKQHAQPRTSLDSLAKGSWLVARLACFKYHRSSRYLQRPNHTKPICRKTERSPPRSSSFQPSLPTPHSPIQHKTGQRFSHRYPVLLLTFIHRQLLRRSLPAHTSIAAKAPYTAQFP